MMFFDDSEDGDSTNGDGSNSEGYTDYSSYSETHMISTKIRIPIISKQKIQVSTIHQVKILKVMILTLTGTKWLWL